MLDLQSHLLGSHYFLIAGFRTFSSYLTNITFTDAIIYCYESALFVGINSVFQVYVNLSKWLQEKKLGPRNSLMHCNVCLRCRGSRHDSWQCMVPCAPQKPWAMSTVLGVTPTQFSTAGWVCAEILSPPNLLPSQKKLKEVANPYQHLPLGIWK